MIPRHRVFQLRMNKSLRIRNPIEGDVVVTEKLPTGNLSHNDNYVFLDIVAADEADARSIFNSNKKEIIRYLWDNTPVNAPEDVVAFINEAAGMEIEKGQSEKIT